MKSEPVLAYHDIAPAVQEEALMYLCSASWLSRCTFLVGDPTLCHTQLNWPILFALLSGRSWQVSTHFIAGNVIVIANSELDADSAGKAIKAGLL